MTGEAGRRGRLSRWLYRRLLAVYPRRFRDRFGERMQDDFARLYDAGVAAAGWRGALRVWGGILRDTVRAAAGQHREAWRDATRRRVRADPPGRPRSGARAALRDVRTAVRGLARRPGFALAAITTLALAIGANTALYSVLRGVVLRPLPYPEPDRLVLLSEGGSGFNNVSYPNALDWRERARGFQEIGAFSLTALNITGGAVPLRVTVGRADPSFLSVAGLEPMMGRSFLDEENVADAPPVAILSHGLWQESFGADPDVLGRSLSLNGRPTEVVGVLPPGADFADEGIALWIPIVPAIGDWAHRREVHALSVLARLAPGAELETVRRDLARLAEDMAAEYPDQNAGRGARVLPLADALVGDVSMAIWLLMGMVSLVLMIACANVGGLTLVRLSARAGELGVRRALGASRWDVTRLLMTEALVLATVGGAAGVGLAYASLGPVSRLLRGRLPRVETVALDANVLMVAVGLSLVVGLAFGLLSGWSGSARAGALRSGEGRGTRGSSPRGAFARSALCTGQVAGSVVLVICAGLLMRSLHRLQSEDVGFQPDNLATMAVSLAGSGRETEEVVQFYRELPPLLEGLPGVVSAAAVNSLPISGGDSNGSVTVEGLHFQPGEAPTASFRRITPGYFRTVGTPIHYGRDFTASDTGDHLVTIINESMARRLWTDPADAVGARIKVGPPEHEPWLTVVGVAGDVRNVGLASEPRLATYEPHAQRPWTTMSVVFRTASDPAAVTDLVRQRVRDAGGDVPVYDFATLNERIADSLRPRRAALVLTAVFALLTLVTAAIGLYGVLAFTVSQRTSEFGVRLALGASGRGIARIVAVHAARMLGTGIAMGVIAAAVAGRALESVLHGVPPHDAATLIVGPMTLVLVGVLACAVPARRALRIDPATSLRSG